MEQNEHNNHSGIGSIAGFVYQDYFFLFKLLTLQPGEKVSFEMFEDVGVEENEKKIYYQQKHTIKGSIDKPIKMAERDNDLWKTFSVWIDILTKKGTEQQQRDWIASSRFILLSNKDACNNTLWKKIQEFQMNETKYDELESFINELYNNTSDSVYQDGKEVVESDKKKKIRMLMEYPLKKEFLQNVSFEFKTDDDIIDDIKHNIRFQHNTPEINVHECMITLLGELRYSYKDSIQKGKALEFDEESFDERFGSYFNIYKRRKFVPINRNIDIPKEPLKLTFMKQLLEVKYLRASDIDTVRDYAKYRIDFGNSYNHALKFTGEQGRKYFENEVKQRWRYHFNKENIDIEEDSSEKNILYAGRNVVLGVMKEDLKFEEDQLTRTQSNGCFFYFSDGERPKLGWRYDWKNKYNGIEWITE